MQLIYWSISALWPEAFVFRVTLFMLLHLPIKDLAAFGFFLLDCPLHHLVTGQEAVLAQTALPAHQGTTLMKNKTPALHFTLQQASDFFFFLIS